MNTFDEDAFIDLPIIMDGFINDYFFKKSGSLVYHYASFENTLSITGNFVFTAGGSVLYHTRYNELSDDYEGQEVEECYLEALNKYCLSHKLEKRVADLLYSIKPNDTYLYYMTERAGVDHAYKAKGIAYICCFSFNGDSEYMWNNYLKGEKSGFAIGYNTTNLKSNANDYFGNGYKHIIQKVLYKKEDKIKFIYDFLNELLSKTHREPALNFYVSNFLNCNKYVFKRLSFSDEEEVRSVIFYPEDGHCNLKTINNGTIIPFKFDFGTSIDDLIYYHNGNDDREMFLISQTHILNSVKKSKFCK